MKRNLLVTVVATTLLAWCGTAMAAQLKIATLAPDGSFWMTEVRKGADEIEARTAGRVKLRFYPGGTMGNDQMVLRKMRIGQLQGGMVLGGTLATVAPELNVYSLPLVFHSYDEVDQVRKLMDGEMMAALDRAGYVAFGIIEGGFSYIMSDRAVLDFQDLAGRKTWIPEGDVVAQAILEAAGLSPVPLPLSDVLTGLQTGLIDTVAGPPVGAVALQWFTRATHFTDVPILYTYGAIVVSKKALGGLSESDQAAVRQIMGEVTKTLDKRSRKDNLEARDALAKQGMSFVQMTPKGVTRLREVAEEATRKLISSGDVPAAVVDELNGHLSTLRGQ